MCLSLTFFLFFLVQVNLLIPYIDEDARKSETFNLYYSISNTKLYLFYNNLLPLLTAPRHRSMNFGRCFTEELMSCMEEWWNSCTT